MCGIATKKENSASLVEKLGAPFPSSDVMWRVGRAFNPSRGVIFPYVTSRGIQKRLDDVFGVDGWDNEFSVVPEIGAICTLVCRCDGKEFRKSDGSQFTAVEPLKGGLSGALKRAASQLGIGRYLYDVGEVVVDLENKQFRGKVILPDEFLPASEQTGNTELKVVYGKSRGGYGNGGANASHSEGKKDGSPMTLEEAMNFVVRNDKFNSGKKMSEVWNKTLVFLANGRDEEQAQAARIVAEHKGVRV